MRPLKPPIRSACDVPARVVPARLLATSLPLRYGADGGAVVGHGDVRPAVAWDREPRGALAHLAAARRELERGATLRDRAGARDAHARHQREPVAHDRGAQRTRRPEVQRLAPRAHELRCRDGGSLSTTSGVGVGVMAGCGTGSNSKSQLSLRHGPAVAVGVGVGVAVSVGVPVGVGVGVGVGSTTGAASGHAPPDTCPSTCQLNGAATQVAGNAVRSRLCPSGRCRRGRSRRPCPSSRRVEHRQPVPAARDDRHAGRRNAVFHAPATGRATLPKPSSVSGLLPASEYSPSTSREARLDASNHRRSEFAVPATRRHLVDPAAARRRRRHVRADDLCAGEARARRAGEAPGHGRAARQRGGHRPVRGRPVQLPNVHTASSNGCDEAVLTWFAERASTVR